MTSDVLTRTRGEVPRAVQEELQATLLELIELALQGKQAHWNVTGAQFRSVHHELDEIVETARWAADEVAERMATLGVAPDGRLPTLAAARLFEQFPQGSVADVEVVARMGVLLDELNGRLDTRIAQLGDVDPISQGILIGCAERLQKHAWMLRAQRS
jgi:starvation-inducible DNA-binding protein